MQLAVIAYSCFTSMFFVSFDYPFVDDPLLYGLELVVLVFFSADLIFNFFREPAKAESDKVWTHTEIAKNYMKGSFIIDISATFPFFLLNTGKANYGLYFKLLRLIRLPKIMNLLDMEKFNKVSEALFAGVQRSKRIVYQNACKNIYRVMRLVMQTVIITYFMGCLFFMISSF
jgi:hypothetical protein